MSIELEKRGGLDIAKKRKLLDFLHKNARFLGEYHQNTIFIEFGSKHLGEIQNTKNSIAITQKQDCKTGKKEFELKVKNGNMQKGYRPENCIRINPEDIFETVSFLSVFEITTGCPRYYHRYDFEYRNFFMSIKEGGYAPDHFEIELMLEDVKDLPEAERKIDTITKKLNLSTYTDDEYKMIMLGTYAKYPPVKLTRKLIEEFF